MPATSVPDIIAGAAVPTRRDRCAGPDALDDQMRWTDTRIDHLDIELIWIRMIWTLDRNYRGQLLDADRHQECRKREQPDSVRS
jgi:hypothetical protein